ncbi:MAG: hypothetical protein DLM54_02065 [Acidimicrobiales bacterium]|nr:MAG: hypothetical protein DLM54_02065 [Acidimicrobiales bacterium]
MPALDDLIVACLDIGVDTGLVAYATRYTSAAPVLPSRATGSNSILPGVAYRASHVRTYLTGDLTAWLQEGNVALGFEAPCWGAAETGPFGALLERPWETHLSKKRKGPFSYSWANGSGGSAALKVSAYLPGLLYALKQQVPNLLVTYDGAELTGRAAGGLWLWEAYAAGCYKILANQPPPVTYRGGTTGPTNSDVRDAWAAVELGFANKPTRSNPPTKLAQGTIVVPLLGPLLTAAGVATNRPGAAPPHWWNDPCLVIAQPWPSNPGGSTSLPPGIQLYP